jgi:thiol-disulfide isomerase/thioredoxin
MKFHLSKNTKNIITVILALLVVLAIISYFTQSKKTSNAPSSIYEVNNTDNMTSYASFENFENKEKPKVMLFHATWCGHCEQYLSSGIFDKVAKHPEVQQTSFEKFDADKNEDIREKYDVTSFPTILGLNTKGEKVGFDGNRNSVEDLVSFAKSLL